MTEAVGDRPAIGIMRKGASPWLLAPLSAIYFISGSSGLIYEVVWTRLLSLSFGVTIYAISVVLATFMAGLALGSFLAGRVADRARQPLLWYAGLEVLIGLLGLLSLAALEAITPAYVWLYHVSGDSLQVAGIGRILLSALVLLLPTVAMGATFPFIMRSSLVFLPHLGTNLSLLYALNTAGAASGTFSAGFFLIGNIGFSASVIVAAALNLTAAVLAFFLAKATPAENAPESTDPHASEAPTVDMHPAVPAVVLVAMWVSGFCALAYEVIWFRILDLFLNGTAYAFSLMLTIFLVGLAAGSILIQPFIRRNWNWLLVLGLIELGIALESSYAVLALGGLPAIRDMLAGDSLLTPLTGRPVVTMTILCGVLLLPLTMLLGMTFPVAGQVLTQAGFPAGRAIGRLNASNTVGAILGSLIGGLWLLPTLGTQEGVLLMGKVNGVLAIALLALTVRYKAVVLAAAGVSALLLLNPMLSATKMMPGVLAQLFKGNELLWYEEGLENTVSIQKRPDGFTFLYLNNREQASDSKGMVDYHRLIGQLGLLLHPDPKETLVIGLGGGATAAALTELSTNRVDSVELSPSVVRAAEQMPSVNQGALARPNMRMIVDDGRNYMLLSDKKYDIITADIIQPIYAGSGNLYSKEYFQLARSALKEKGIMVQWVNPGLTHIHPMIVRTFHESFPYVSMWFSNSLLVGSNEPIDISPAEVERLLNRPGVGEIARGMSMTSADRLLQHYNGTTAEYVQKIPPGPILTDDRPLTEYFRSAPEGGSMDISSAR